MTHDRTPQQGLQVHDSAGVIAPPPLIYGIGFALGLMLNRLMPIPIARHHERACRATGLVLATLGLGISAAVVRAFRAAGTSISTTRPTSRLVCTGPFRFSRNPDYIGQLLVYVGASAGSNSWWPILIAPFALGLIQRGVLRREERYLEKKFGQEYRDYAANVHRWI